MLACFFWKQASREEKTMKTFKLDKNTEVICEWKKTRMAFKHVATLMINGYEEDSAKICYQNRTWEGFEFESVLNKLLDKTKVLTERKRTNFLKKFSRRIFKSIHMMGIP